MEGRNTTMLAITAGEIGAKRETRSIPLSNFGGVSRILPTLQYAVSFPCVSWRVELSGGTWVGS